MRQVALINNGAVVQSQAWSGNLASYAYDTLFLDNITTSGGEIDLRVIATQPNGLEDDDHSNDTTAYALRAATYWDSPTIEVEVQADGYGHQLYWDIKDDFGVVIDFGGNKKVGLLDGWGAPNDPETEYADFEHETRTVSLEGHAASCVTIRVISAYGYGVCCDYAPATASSTLKRY